MNNLDKEIEVLDQMLADDEYIAARRKFRDEERAYKLAKKQNIYNKIVGTLRDIKRVAIPILVAGFTVFSSIILLAASYKWDNDDKLYKQLHTPLKYYSYQIPDDEEIVPEYFEYGTSADIDKINVIMNNSALGYYIYRSCESQGVDPNVMASIMNYEGILDNFTSRDVVEHRVEKFGYDTKIIYNALKTKYPHLSSEQLNSALLLCSTEAEHIGLDVMINVINNYKLFNSSNEFDYNKFKEAIGSLELDNKNDRYLNTIFEGVSSSELKFVVDGEDINYSLNNDINHLNSDGRKLL